MKLYKILIVLIAMICLTACQSTEFQYDLNELKSEVISVEIVNAYYDSNNLLVIDVVRTINQVDIEELLIDFSKIQFTILIGNPQITNGDALKINYVDGYEIVSYNSILKYNFIDESMTQDDIYTPKEFEDFILKWKQE